MTPTRHAKDHAMNAATKTVADILSNLSDEDRAWALAGVNMPPRTFLKLSAKIGAR